MEMLADRNVRGASVIPERYHFRDGAKMAIKQGDIPECLFLESFRTTILVQ